MQPRMLSQRRKRLAKRRRSARYASNVAERLMQCLEHEYGDVVAIAIGVAIGAKQSPAHEPGKGQGMRCEAEQSGRSEEHTSELQSLMRISSAVFCLKKKRE